MTDPVFSSGFLTLWDSLAHKDSNEKWLDSRSHPKISFPKDVRKMIEFLPIALLTFGLFVPGAFAGPDPFASGQNPLAYSVVSASHESILPLHSLTLYLSGREDLPTTVSLPTVTVRKIGMDSPKGWTYESRTTNTPVYRKRGGIPRNGLLSRRLKSWPCRKPESRILSFWTVGTGSFSSTSSPGRK